MCKIIAPSIIFAFALLHTFISGIARAEDGDPDIINSSGFIDTHPDVRFRLAGDSAYREGRYGDAFKSFKESARYADKLSQAMVAEMLWKGEGVAQDRPLAYAWMDLAAERGYKELLAIRERYWSEINADERKRAVEVGQAVYADFADSVAKPRMNRELRRARISVTGSHLGHVKTSWGQVFHRSIVKVRQRRHRARLAFGMSLLV